MAKLKTYSEISSLWLKYKDGLKYYIFKKVKNEDMANDLSHEVLMKIYNSCCSNIEIKNVRSWIFQIAHNTTVDYLKKQSKFVSKIPEQYDNSEQNKFMEVDGILRPLIMLLPEKYAIPLELADLKSYKQEEVARMLNLSLTATKTRIHRARKLLKEKIIECSNLEKDDVGNLISLEIKSECNPNQEPSGKKIT